MKFYHNNKIKIIKINFLQIIYSNKKKKKNLFLLKKRKNLKLWLEDFSKNYRIRSQFNSKMKKSLRTGILIYLKDEI